MSKKNKKSKSKNKIGSTTMSFVVSSIKYNHFICKDDFPEIIYFTKSQTPKMLKVNNQTEYFNSTMSIEFTIEGKIAIIDTNGSVVKPISIDKGKGTKTYNIPFVDFLKAIEAYINDENPSLASIYAAKDTKTNQIFWLWRCTNGDCGTIRTPKNTIYINFDI